MAQITTQDLLLLLGQKEVEIAVLRQELAQAKAKLEEKAPKEG